MNMHGWLGLFEHRFGRKFILNFLMHCTLFTNFFNWYQPICFISFFNLLQLEEAVAKMIGSIWNDQDVTIDWSLPRLRTPLDYVESWTILYWERAFGQFFGSKDQNLHGKRSVFKDYPKTDIVVKRVVYRY